MVTRKANYTQGTTNTTRVVDLAALRGVPAGTDGDQVEVTQHSTSGDNGGGTFYWDSSSSASDDDGVVVLPTGHSGNGRWLRRFSDRVNAKWFGLRDDTLTFSAADNAAAIVAALPYGETYIPKGSYTINQVAFPGSGQKLIGAGRHNTVLHGTVSSAGLIEIQNKIFCSMESLTIKADDTSTHGLDLLQSGTNNCTGCSFSNLRFVGPAGQPAFTETHSRAVYGNKAALGYANYFHHFTDIVMDSWWSGFDADWNANAWLVNNVKFQSIWRCFNLRGMEWVCNNLWWHSSAGNGTDGDALFANIQGISGETAQYNQFINVMLEPGVTNTSVYDMNSFSNSNFIQGGFQIPEGTDNGTFNLRFRSILGRNINGPEFNFNVPELYINKATNNDGDGAYDINIFGDGTNAHNGTGTSVMRLFDNNFETRHGEVGFVSNNFTIAAHVAGSLHLDGFAGVKFGTNGTLIGLPTADGISGQAIVTDGAGQTSFVTVQTNSRTTVSPAAGSYNDWSPTGYDHETSVIHVSPAGGAATITGLDSTDVSDGHILTIIASGVSFVHLKHDDALSTAANRFYLPHDVETLSLNLEDVATFIYDGTDSRWRCIATSPAREMKTTSPTSGTFNDWNPQNLSSRTRALIVTPSAGNCTITGLSATRFVGGSRLDIVAGNTFTLILTNQGAGSTAANRFQLPAGYDEIRITDNDIVTLIYDDSISRWRVHLPHTQFTNVINPGTLTGNYNDWAPTGYYGGRTTTIIADLTGTMTLTGIDSTHVQDGHRLRIILTAAQTLRIRHQNTGSSAANRIENLQSWADLYLGENDSVDLEYDGVNSYWRVINHTRQKQNFEFSQALSSSSNSTTLDLNNGPRYDLLNLNEDTTLQVPTNEYEGAEITIVATQDGTGNRKLSFASGYVNVGSHEGLPINPNADAVIKAWCVNDGGLTWYYTIEHRYEEIEGAVTTSDATATNIFTFGPQLDETWVLEYDVIGKQTGSTNTAKFSRRSTITRSNAGTLTIKQTDTLGTDVNDNSYAITISVLSGTTYRVQVTGVAATNMSWTIRGRRHGLRFA